MTAAFDLDGLLEALAAKLAPLVAARMTAPANGITPLVDVAAKLGMSARHLKSFCGQHEIAVTGTRKRPLVDAAAVDAAMATTRRPTRPAAPGDRVADLVRRRTGGA